MKLTQAIVRNAVLKIVDETPARERGTFTFYDAVVEAAKNLNITPNELEKIYRNK